MAGKRLKKNKIAEGLMSKLKGAISFGSARRDEVASSLNRKKEFELEETEMAESYFDDFLNGEIVPENFSGPVPDASLNPPVPPASPDLRPPQEPPVPPRQPAGPDMISSIQEQGGMKAFADGIYNLSRTNEVRAMFLLLINNYEKVMRENPTNTEIVNKLEEMKNLLGEFDIEIEVIRTRESIDKDVQAINKVLDEIKKEYDILLTEIEQNDFSNINNFANVISSKLNGTTTQSGFEVGNFYSHVRSMQALLLKYKALAKEDYAGNIKINYFSLDIIRAYYEKIAIKISELEEKAEQFETTDQQLYVRCTNLIKSMNNIVNSLLVLSNNPKEFAAMRAEVDKLIEKNKKDHGEQPEQGEAPVNNAMEEALKKSFEIVLTRKYDVICEKVKALFSEFKTSDAELDKLIEELNTFLDSERTLSTEVKEEIRDRVSADFDEKLCKFVGIDLYNYIYDYAPSLSEKLEELADKEYGTLDFEFAYGNLKDLLETMIKEGERIGVKVTFAEDSQVLNIDFGSPVMKNYRTQIVSDEVLTKMNGETFESDEENLDANKESLKEELRNRLDEIYNEYDRLFHEEVRELNIKDESVEWLESELYKTEIDPKYGSLRFEEYKTIFDEVRGSHTKRIFDLYGQDIISDVRLLTAFIADLKLDCLNGLEYNTEEFNNAHKDVLDSISSLLREIKDYSVIKIIQDISFDYETQRLKIVYNNPNLEPFEKQIVSDEVLAQMRAERLTAASGSVPPVPPTPPRFGPGSNHQESPVPPRPIGGAGAVPPIPPMPPTPPIDIQPDLNPPRPIFTIDEMDVAIHDYIYKLEEANNIVDLINDINANLEAQAVMSFIGVEEAKNTIELEKEAKELDQRLINLRIELSKDRLVFKQKFNKFILAMPEVKMIEQKEITFSGSLNDFISQHDEMVVEAEKEIFALDRERKDNPDRLEEINKEIQILLDFIEAQNSLVGRRLVSEAKTTDLDIVSLISQRRENKKAIRERLRQVRENTQVLESDESILGGSAAAPEPEPAPVPAPVPEPAPGPAPVSPETHPEGEQDEDTLSEEELRKQEQLRIQRFDYLQELLESEVRKQIKEDRTSYSERTFRQNFMEGTKEFITELKKDYASEVIETVIGTYEVKYIKASNIEKSGLISEMFEAIERLRHMIPKDDVLEEGFDEKLANTLDALVKEFNEIEDLKVEYNAENNTLSVSYVANLIDFDTPLIKREQVQKYVGDFLAPSAFEAYRDNKKKEVVVTNELLQTVGDYFINGYSNGKVVFQSVAKNDLLKEGLNGVDIEVAIDRLIQMGVIEERMGLLRAACTKEEFLDKMTKTEEKDSSDVGAPVEGEPTQEESQVNIVQRGLVFNPKNLEQLADRSKDVITSGDVVTVSLIKNGIKIKYSQELREKLSQLNAKLSLVSKENELVSLSSAIDETTLAQEITLDDRELKPEDYKIEIRVPGDDLTSTLYEFDLENVSDELKRRSK